MSQTYSLPLLDFAEFRQGGEKREKFLNELIDAANKVGFFYLKNHGVDLELGQKVKDISKQFFELPLEDRLSVQMVNSPHFRGYTKLHDEITLGKPDAREQFDFMPELEAYPLDEIPEDQPWLRLQGPNQWPSALPEMKPTFIEWQKQQTALAKELIGAFALALKQPEDIFAENLAGTPSVLSKVIHYPGIKNSEQGVGPHKDAGYITFVYQDIYPGLEVLVDDEWVLAEIIPDTFVVNIGELLELASSGYLKATYHRVVTPKPGESRYSVAYFMTSRLDQQVPILNLPPELAKNATGATADPKNPLFTKIGKNFLKGRLRSHPDVAARHYPNINIEHY